MSRIAAQSQRAGRALKLLTGLQTRFAERLGELELRRGGQARPLSRVEWLRDGGQHGGGHRRVAGAGGIFNRASVNISQVHYDDMPDKKLASATALSTIVHPDHPLAPSMHMHISWTEMRGQTGYWRVMADLNPAIAFEEDREQFLRVMRGAAPESCPAALEQGDRYFQIPVLERTRGVAHFYLEGYTGASEAAEVALAEGFGGAVIEAYVDIVDRRLETSGAGTAEQRAQQLAYHTLYMFQVLTLDRGTTSGLLVHDQNDVGILGSLPSRVDRELLASWVPRMPEPQGVLLEQLIAALPSGASAVTVDDPVKRELAAVVRAHYTAHPQALALQARGDRLPSTVANHR